MRGPSYLGLTRSISWLLMPWLLTSTGNQQPRYWLYRLWRSFSYLRKDFKYLCQKSLWSNDIKCKYMLMFPLKNLARKGLIWRASCSWDQCIYNDAQSPCSTIWSAAAIWTFNTLRLRQIGRCFTDDIFKVIFLNENVWIVIKISLQFVPKGPSNNIPALVQIMAWRCPGNEPLSEPMMVS